MTGPVMEIPGAVGQMPALAIRRTCVKNYSRIDLWHKGGTCRCRARTLVRG